VKVYNIQGGGLISGYGAILNWQRMYDPSKPTKTQRQKDLQNAALYQCLFFMGSTLPTMAFEHVLALVERKAKITPVGDDGACRIEIDA